MGSNCECEEDRYELSSAIVGSSGSEDLVLITAFIDKYRNRTRCRFFVET